MASLEIIDIKPRGYCKGVVRALNIVKQTRKRYPDEKISVLGKIVHNRFITSALDYYHIHTIDVPGMKREEMLQFVDRGILILSAHGSSEQVKKMALSKGLKLIDAACMDVLSTHQIIDDAIKNQYQVLYIGKKHHPETEAVLENFQECHLITDTQDIFHLKLPSDQKIMVTNQTTLSILEMKQLYDAILEKFPNAEITDEICNATRIRQEAIIRHSGLDVLIVVGDPKSNNTAMLAQIGRESGIHRVQRIETVHDLNLAQLKEGMRIGVTSGASTPRYLTEMVSDYLRNLDPSNPHAVPDIDLSRILD